MVIVQGSGKRLEGMVTILYCLQKMSDHPQIKGFVYKHGCVCAAFDQEQLCPRNLPCHVPGVRNLHKIPGSGNEKYRCLDSVICGEWQRSAVSCCRCRKKLPGKGR